MRLYFIALQFLTIIPLPFSLRWEEKDMGRSLSFFPLAGLTIGALLVGANWLLSLVLPRGVTDLLLIAILAVVTGVLHLDGLADVCDGLAARGGRDRFLEVMKDSRTGAAGAVGVVIALLLKYQALLLIPLDMKRGALLCFPLLARFTMAQMTIGSPAARKDGLGSAFIGDAGWVQMLAATASTLIFLLLLLGIDGLWLFIASYLLTWALKGWFNRKAGGVTGDIIGFTGELNEILALLMILAFTWKPVLFV